MFTLESTECGKPDKTFITLYIVGMAGLILAAASGTLSGSLTASTLMMAIIFSILGGVALLRDISIVKCPTRILVGAVIFIAVTAILDANVF
ncbi:MAG TPA: hypothetical protein ENJ84_12455 [Gammaproteobacteria bacterium]|nr:hypothetical protein [Gammaproteobacteria bacterium]